MGKRSRSREIKTRFPSPRFLISFFHPSAHRFNADSRTTVPLQASTASRSLSSDSQQGSAITRINQYPLLLCFRSIGANCYPSNWVLAIIAFVTAHSPIYSPFSLVNATRRPLQLGLVPLGKPSINIHAHQSLSAFGSQS